MTNLKYIKRIFFISILQFIIICVCLKGYSQALENRFYTPEDAIVPYFSSYEDFVGRFLDSVQKVYEMANKNWTYGDSNVLPPCDDGYISCDRLVSRALWEIGFTDQAKGGFVVTSGEPGDYLPAHNFEWVPNQYDIRPGDIIKIRGDTGHVFVIKEYDPDTQMCLKYDCRINSEN